MPVQISNIDLSLALLWNKYPFRPTSTYVLPVIPPVNIAIFAWEILSGPRDKIPDTVSTSTRDITYYRTRVWKEIYFYGRQEGNLYYKFYQRRKPGKVKENHEGREATITIRWSPAWGDEAGVFINVSSPRALPHQTLRICDHCFFMVSLAFPLKFPGFFPR